VKIQQDKHRAESVGDFGLRPSETGCTFHPSTIILTYGTGRVGIADFGKARGIGLRATVKQALHFTGQSST